MKKNYIKIICMVFAILIISISPFAAYLNSYNSCAYAFELTIEDSAAKYVLPVAAYMVLTYEKTLQGYETLTNITIEEIEKKIVDITTSAVDYAVNIPVTQKVAIAKLYTELTTPQINQALGTSYSDAEINSLTSSIVTNFNNGTIGSTYKDIYDLGIAHVSASHVKAWNNMTFDMVKNYEQEYVGDVRTIVHDFGSGDAYIGIRPFVFDFWNLFNYAILVTSTYYTYLNTSTYSRLGLCVFQTYNIASNYRLNFNIVFQQRFTRPSLSFSLPDDIIYNNLTAIDTFHGYNKTSLYTIEYLQNGIWQEIYRNENLLDVTVKDLFDTLLSKANINLTGTSYYTDDVLVTDVVNRTFQGTTILNSSAGTMAIPYGIPAVDSGFFTGEDVSQGDVERLIESLGQSTTTWDVELQTETKVNDDPDTNIDYPFVTDVVLSPTTELEVPDVNTSNPDESGDIGNPDDTTGILGWLKGFWELLKSLWERLLAFLASIVALLTSIFTNTGNLSESAQGTDWGNFKNFFDIFWIFYYLIILAIIILLKFFSVIMSILIIPANTALFDQYPTMLSGLNYIKNIKVGGFNVTLQVIFEYMFTVFFFLYIVTTLQKLYHSFMGIERVQRRENEREARYEKYDNERHYEPNNFTKGMMHANEQKPNNGLSFKDEDYENIKFTDWGD